MRDWNELQQERSVRGEKPTKFQMAFRIRGARHAFEQAQTKGLSQDTKFDLLYDSAYKWSDVVIRAEGWRTLGEGHHEAVFSGLLHFIGAEVEDHADYLDRCRSQRHGIHYEWRPDIVTVYDAADLQEFVEELERIVLSWLNDKHPHLMPD